MVFRLLLSEEHLEERALAQHLYRDAALRRQFPQARLEQLSGTVELLVDARLAQHLERGQAGSRGNRVAVERAAQVRHRFAPPTASRIGHRHDLGLAGDGRQGIPTADRLPVRGQVRHDPVALLGAAVGQPEAGDDLVEDQEHAVLLGQPAQLLEKARRRDERALQRLADHGSQLVRVLLDEPLGQFQVVPPGDQHRLGDLGRDAVGIGDRLWIRRRLRGHRAHHGVVVDPVKAPFELEDLLLAGVSASDPQGVEGRL
ncbi:hypothetical protein HRbin26_00935 [bacterium HR26]|nr:hypothetical protein HRbin26_00935 [bacterium HR26]